MATIKECDRCTGREDVKKLDVQIIGSTGTIEGPGALDICKPCRLALAEFYKPLPKCEEPAPRKLGAA